MLENYKLTIMKELSIEEKAERYDKSFERAKEQLNGAKVFDYDNEQIAHDIRTTVYNIFPNLKESEDEKIRKELIDAIQGLWENDALPMPLSVKRKDNWVAWLEKQGEQKSKKVSLWKHWKDGIAGNGEGKPIYLVKVDNTYRLTSCLGFECDYIDLSELDSLMFDKQGEQKSFDYENANIQQKDFAPKVEPKFHEGDWTVSKLDKEARQISEVHFDEYNSYYVVNGKCVNLEEYDRLHHLWTIQDAKDGDVLVAKGEYFKEYIFIYSKMTDDDVISTHCGYDVIRNASNKTMSRFGRVEDFHSVCPATKGQRDQLEKAMADAGFTFDFDKKELKKIEQKPVVIPKFKVGDKVKKGYLTYTVEDINEDSYKLQAYSKDGDKGCTVFLTIGYEKDYELVEQKPAWSEEDERKFSDILALLRGGENCHYNTPVLFDFLKSLKDRVGNFDDGYKVGFSAAKHNQWKPSDEQMQLLKEACDQHWEPDGLDPLYTLYQDLLKLKG